jgi:chromosome segregation ATPase
MSSTTAEVERLEDALMLLRERYRKREAEIQILASEIMRLQVHLSVTRARLDPPGKGN